MVRTRRRPLGRRERTSLLLGVASGAFCVALLVTLLVTLQVAS